MIQLPWVSRLAFELAIQGRDDARADLVKEQARTKELTDTVLRMKETGAVVAPHAPDFKLPRREVTEFEYAIQENARARRDPKLAGHLRTWSERELKRPLRDGESEEQRVAMILERLRGWATVTNDEEDEDDVDRALRAIR